MEEDRSFTTSYVELGEMSGRDHSPEAKREPVLSVLLSSSLEPVFVAMFV